MIIRQARRLVTLRVNESRSRARRAQAVHEPEQFAAFLPPGARIGDALQVTDHAFAIDHDRGGALDENVYPLQIETLIDRTVGIGQYRKRSIEPLGVLAGAIERVAQNHQHLGSDRSEILVKAPQLAHVLAAVQSTVLAHEEQYNVRFAPVVRQANLAAGAGRQLKVGRQRAFSKFVGIGHRIPPRGDRRLRQKSRLSRFRRARPGSKPELYVCRGVAQLV